jgi:hypothetical protein
MGAGAEARKTEVQERNRIPGRGESERWNLVLKKRGRLKV